MHTADRLTHSICDLQRLFGVVRQDMPNFLPPRGPDHVHLAQDLAADFPRAFWQSQVAYAVAVAVVDHS